MSPDATIPIKVRRLPDQWSLYNDWSYGDTKLDWDGAEPGQGQHYGQDALGTPAGEYYECNKNTNRIYVKDGLPTTKATSFITVTIDGEITIGS